MPGIPSNNIRTPDRMLGTGLTLKLADIPTSGPNPLPWMLRISPGATAPIIPLAAFTMADICGSTDPVTVNDTGMIVACAPVDEIVTDATYCPAASPVG